MCRRLRFVDGWEREGHWINRLIYQCPRYSKCSAIHLHGTSFVHNPPHSPPTPLAPEAPSLEKVNLMRVNLASPWNTNQPANRSSFKIIMPFINATGGAAATRFTTRRFSSLKLLEHKITNLFNIKNIPYECAVKSNKTRVISTLRLIAFNL